MRTGFAGYRCSPASTWRPLWRPLWRLRLVGSTTRARAQAAAAIGSRRQRHRQGDRLQLEPLDISYAVHRQSARINGLEPWAPLKTITERLPTQPAIARVAKPFGHRTGYPEGIAFLERVGANRRSGHLPTDAHDGNGVAKCIHRPVVVSLMPGPEVTNTTPTWPVLRA